MQIDEDRLRGLFDSTDVGIVMCDARGEILLANKCADDILDRPRNATELADWLATTHPDDRTQVAETIDTAGRLERVSSLRHRVVHRDGTEVWVEHSVAPFRPSSVASAGDLTGFVSTLVDVTVEHTAMVELAASRDFTEALLDTASVLVIVVDRTGRILRFNKACEASTGFLAAEIVGTELPTTLLPPDQQGPVRDILARLSETNEEQVSGSLENEWLTASGHRRRVSWTYTTVALPDGSLGVMGTGIDVTEQRLLELRVAQADRLESIGRVAAGVAHDFNNTLTTLQLRIDRLNGRELDEASRADIAAAMSTIERTQRLINDLLSFSSRADAKPEPIAITAEIHRVVDNFTELFGDEITFEVDLAADATVLIDPARFEQALSNLAWNARDAMPEGGVLRISTEFETIEAFAPATAEVPVRLGPGDYVVLDVADTGVGIEPGVAPHVFDPYFTTKPGGRGTGLGLATTYGTIVQSGGAITVDSTPGAGTTFRIWLPLAPATGKEADTFRTEREPSSAVLVVEDDDDLRPVVIEELARLGYRTAGAGTAAEALALIDRPVDVLVCDVQLPDGSGPEVAAHFRDRHRDLEVVYVSGAAPTQLRGFLPSDTPVVTKPFAIGELVGAISAAALRAADRSDSA